MKLQSSFTFLLPKQTLPCAQTCKQPLRIVADPLLCISTPCASRKTRERLPVKDLRKAQVRLPGIK